MYAPPNLPQLHPPPTDETTFKVKRARNVYYKVYEAKNKTYSDQTDRFPFNSQRGYKYIMVKLEVDTNASLVIPFKTGLTPTCSDGTSPSSTESDQHASPQNAILLTTNVTRACRHSYDNIVKSSWYHHTDIKLMSQRSLLRHLNNTS